MTPLLGTSVLIEKLGAIAHGANAILYCGLFPRPDGGSVFAY